MYRPEPPEPTNDCATGLVSVDAAFVEIVGRAMPVPGIETVPVGHALGRVTATDLATRVDLPRFDHSAVDGYGLAAADLGRPPPYGLSLAGEVRAGLPPSAPRPGQAVRLFTGAPVGADVAAVVVEERCVSLAGRVDVTVAVAAGANIRRSGEDVAAGETIVEAGTALDARHIAILVAAGVETVPVRRRIRVAVLSNGNELAADGDPTQGRIPDANRPMLMALLSRPFVEVVDAGLHPDDAPALARAFAAAADMADVVVSSGGVAGSEADHVARAVHMAGGVMQRFRLALRPGKPILVGRIGQVPVLGLPGNPVAAMVNFLLLGRPLVGRVAGLPGRRPAGDRAVAAEPFPHRRGRTEFMPVAVEAPAADGRLRLRKLGRGGSARLRPLVLADGLAEIPSGAGDIGPGEALRFHPFTAAFAP